MTSSPVPPIRLHRRPTVRPVVLDGDDDQLRREVGEQVAALFDHPPGLVLTGSCSAALEVAATSLALAPGDEVIVPAFTFPTSVSPFLARGAVVRFADVDPRTANLDVAAAGALVGPRTRAIVPMHYGGAAVDLSPIAALLADGGIDVVEDAAHATFARCGGRAVGRTGRFAAVSFHRTKNLSALEGGALVVNDPGDLEAALVAVDKGTDRAAFVAGRRSSYDWQGLGSAWRMTEGSLRYLAAELEGAERDQRRRLEVWDRYHAALGGWAVEQGVQLPAVPPGCELPAHLYSLVLPRAADRDRFVAHCAERGVEAARHYSSMPSSPHGERIRHGDDTCPVAADLAVRLVRIPLHPALGDDDVERVVDAVTSWRSPEDLSPSR